jgi:DnaJ-class molecular chaperone
MKVYKRVRRLVMVLCSNCLGSGSVTTKNDQKKCPDCKGKGEVEKWIVEIVNEDE